MSSICNLSAREYVQAANNHADATEDFVKRAEHLLKIKPYEITTCCSDFGFLIKKRANAVIRETYLLSSYIRLKPYPEMLLVGKCNPDHNTGSSISKSLSRRFNGFIILIITKQSKFLSTERTDIGFLPEIDGKDEEEVIKQIRKHIGNHIRERLNDDLVREDGDFLWKKYYETQYLEQRLNIRQFRKFIPKYVMTNANMKIENEFYKKVVKKRKERKTLDYFFL